MTNTCGIPANGRGERHGTSIRRKARRIHRLVPVADLRDFCLCGRSFGARKKVIHAVPGGRYKQLER